MQKLIFGSNLKLYVKEPIKFKISQGLQFAMKNVSTSNMSKCHQSERERKETMWLFWHKWEKLVSLHF